ncbi:ribosomal protein S18 acetylase RimI-like enzyme [Pontibacter ummariensis]|uniref:Ribosomal protein S18 acetylase RimI n=1 Tax=Pontibacter ummariensis TaxID=1610492 RepID=A0A239C7D0_9BACT|nr:GNAT family N-acetyltransferase [Pontibacter ummariensis]PRY15405.1 ribosomal protein S18 acetylase RimI-like enzyme [Pontibacter ummariensis]SNS16117.1 Ribosomal protein S18 acetylase RimI [Pontibacter ummariensis]
MVELIRTNSDNADFRRLVALLDQDLQLRDGEEHSFFAQYNKLDKIHHVVVAYQEGVPAGCGAIKSYAPDTMEIKRMFVHEAFRKQGIAMRVLSELEKWAEELGCSACVLETGKRQPEAIRLYQKSNYAFIPNYGQYAGVESSVCMRKELKYDAEAKASL